MEITPSSPVVENKPTPIKKAPMIKKSKESLIAEYKVKNKRMIKGQIITQGISGQKEITLTYRLFEGDVVTKTVHDRQILELPYGYVKYLNQHGSIKKEKRTPLRLMDQDGNPISVSTQDSEIRYYFKILDFLTDEEMAELDPTTIVKATPVI